MANLAEKTDELLRKQAETLQQTSHTHLQPTSPSLQQDEFDYTLSQCTDAELSECYQPNELSNQRSTVASEASSNYKAASSPAYSSPSHSACATSSRFILKSDSDLQAVKENAVPKNTAKNTTWAVSIWKQWSTHRQKSYPGVYSEWPVHLYLADENTLDYWLSKFVIEARNQKGQPYPPNTLYSVCCGLQRYIKEHRPQLNIFSQPHFAGFRKTLDSEMKRLRSLGMGVNRKQAEPLTVEEENSLWEQGLLGDSSPQTLIDTLLFLCGMHFALRSGQEHRMLQVTQIELVEPSDASPYLIYTENFSKNNAGGISHRKVQPKRVVHHANAENPQRCLVHIYKKYLEHRPKIEEPALYLTPLKKPKDAVWYTKTPIGHNTLAKTVARVCQAGGVPGFKTNHSLRVTTATCLFQRGVDEQLIMACTGYRSIEGVRTYKRISEQQVKDVSTVLNDANNGAPAAKKCKVTQQTEQETTTTNSLLPQASSAVHAGTCTVHSDQETVTNTLIPSAFHFTGCSNITFNMTYT